MVNEREFPLWIVLAIPILFGLAFSLSPRPQQMQDALVSARLAANFQNPAGEEDHILQELAWEPWRPGLWETAGVKAWQAGDAAGAITSLQSARSSGALSPAGWGTLAEAYQALGDWQKAVSVWQQLIVAGGPHADSLFRQILAQQTAHQAFSDALVTAQAWLGRDPASGEAALQAGLLESISDPPAAKPYLDQAAILDSASTSQVSSLQSAIDSAFQQKHPGYRRLVIGRALASLGYWNLAQRSFELATQESPDYAEGWAFLGEARYQLGGDGTAEMEKAQTLDPNSILVRALVALWDRRNNKVDAAFTELQEIARLQPDEPTWQIELGNTADLMGDPYSALSFYQKATQLAPKNARTWLALAEFSAVHQFEARQVGLPAARIALNLTSNSAEALDTMGQLMMVLEDMDSAERFLQQAIEKDAGFAAAYLHLGQLYLQKNQMEQARGPLQQALGLAGKANNTGIVANRLLVRYFGGQ